MGITILIIFVLAIAGTIVWFFIKNKKEDSNIQPEKPISEPSAPPVDNGIAQTEKEPDTSGSVATEPKEPEKPKEEVFMPKFKVGDWLQYRDAKPFLVKEIIPKGYVNGNALLPFEWENEAHIWTIQDAKDGDVLYSSYNLIWIYKDNEHYHVCLNLNLTTDNIDTDGSIIVTNGGCCPANKEQCDILFEKMKEAGYEWDSVRKEVKTKYDEEFEGYLDKYSKFAKIERDSYTYRWFYELFREAKSQLRIDTCHGLPILLKQENFPTLYEWGDKGDAQKAQDTMIGWLFSLQLAELKPYYRADIFKVGYEMGGYDRYSNIYGYKFELDPNVMRILAGAIYPAMKGYCKPVTETLRREVEGTRYNSTLQQLYDNNSRDNVVPNAFFTDFRVFMPTAPAPYATAYSKRGDRTYPNEERDEFDNLKVDRQIHEMIVEAYNLNQPEHYQEVVQAIADKEVEAKHLFGKNRETKNFKFHPVFGEDTIGIELPDEGTLASFAYLAFRTGSSSRGILQSATVNPVQYGRLRPGCSWNQEAKKNSSSDDRRNILTNFEIEDGDGSPTGYYDAHGNWVYMDNIHNPEEYEEYQKNALYANSYPSGHSSGMFCCSMVLIELMPNKADLILREANQYAMNRTIARYHWTSDTLNGRVLGAATNAICHAASDYENLLKESIKEINK